MTDTLTTLCCFKRAEFIITSYYFPGNCVTSSLNSAFHPSGVDESSNRPIWLGLRRGVFTCVGWQVTLCDSMWQLTPRNSEMEFRHPNEELHIVQQISYFHSAVWMNIMANQKKQTTHNRKSASVQSLCSNSARTKSQRIVTATLHISSNVHCMW